ncbi:MAG: GntR family transcriptional regulator, partial [Rhodospirillales bacterium]
MDERPAAMTAAGDAADGVARHGGCAAADSAMVQVADKIRDMVIQDELPPGLRISERQLADQLGVSRTPVREALRILAREGLVETRANRRTFVAEPQPAEISDTLVVLAAVEGVAGEMAIERMSDAEIGEVRALHHEMLAAYARGDRLGYFKKNQEIHLAIVAGARCASLSS